MKLSKLTKYLLPFAPVFAQAQVTFNLDTEFTADLDLQGNAPFVTMVFDDSYGDADQVLLTVTAEIGGLQDNETVKAVYFNFDDSLDVNALSFEIISINGLIIFDENDIYTDKNGRNAGSGTLFDIELDLPPPPGKISKRMTAGEVLEIAITYDNQNLSGNDFLFTNSGNKADQFLAAAHIISIAGGQSDWIAATPNVVVIPEPSTYAGLLLAGIISMVILRRGSK